MKRNTFLQRNIEKEDLNQYWYSKKTIEALVNEVAEVGAEGTAFLSTPSIYFSLPESLRKKCKLFDVDSSWENDSGFIFYDYSKPQDIPNELIGTFSMAIIDPPFIMKDVWVAYAQAINILLKPGGHIIASSIAENELLLNELLGVVPCKFMPSIPNLVYQYKFFINYESVQFQTENAELLANF